MYVYISPLVRETANEHQLLSRIIEIQQQIETGDPLLFGLLFSHHHFYWKKKIRRNWRLIATLIFIGNEQILDLSHLLHRGSDEYGSFLNDPDNWGINNINPDINLLQEWLQERQEVQIIEQLPVPDHLRTWLEKPTLLQRDDKVIFESRDWVEQWQNQNSEIVAHRDSFHQIIVNLLNGSQGELTEQLNIQYYFDPTTDCAIVYSDIHPIDAPNRHIFFLLKAFRERPTDLEIIQLGNSLGMFGYQVNQDLFAQDVTVDDLTRFARRSYPDYLVYYPETWYSLEQERDANLALSSEEEELLYDMSFPAFINGRAGSGKSTMLHYAFAYYCDRYLEAIRNSQFEQLFRPLFLTYSDRLTTRAREVVKRILISHAHYIENNRLITDNLTEIDQCFQPFQAFLLQQLPAEAAERFTIHKYVSFHRFKQLYAHSFPNSRYSAEICWYAIRTYIKGFNFAEEREDFLTAEEYRTEIEQAHKSIADEDFNNIYAQAWQWYQNIQQEQNYWDDQDLVWAVLTNMTQDVQKKECYAAIFCDEAQDFTRIELQIIWRLSIWSQYRLYPPVKSLPFAFAGDPMQTLNPTGFDWNSLRASFYDRILTPLDPDNQIGLRKRDYIMLRELQQNYRSTKDIVRLSNIIHLWRRILFNLQNLQPQITWWQDQSFTPVQKGIIGSKLTRLELRQIAEQNAIFILPCEEGGELDFLRSSSELGQLFSYGENNRCPPNVYSSLTVKGMEFSLVVVCGFGEHFAQAFNNRHLEQFPSQTEFLALEYFLNKLYVAVSRATKVLVIIDTQRGDDCLWESANANQINDWLNLLPQEQRQTWQDNIMVSGLQQRFNTRVLKQSNPLEDAQSFMREGLEQRNSRFLASAAENYDLANQPIEAEYCRVWLERLRGDLRQAGQRFMEISGLTDSTLNPARDAWECFWEGQHWHDILRWCDRNPQATEGRWQPVASFMVTMVQNRETIDRFTAFLGSVFPNTQILAQKQEDTTWKAVFLTYHQAIEQIMAANIPFNSDGGKAWQQTLSRMAEARFAPHKSFALAARCAYQASRYAEAIALWENCPETPYRQQQEYFISQAHVQPIPEKIRWFARANQLQSIVDLWQQEQHQITNQWEPYLNDLRRALEYYGQYKDLLEIDIQLNQWVRAIQMLNSRFEAKDPVFAPSLQLKVLTKMANNPHFQTKDRTNLAKKLLCDFIGRTIKLEEWEANKERIEEAGQAFERISEFRPALEFYERFRNNTTQEICELARSKWIEVKQRQANYSQQRGRLQQAQQQRQEAEQIRQTWRCSPPIDTLRQTVCEQLENLSENELNQVSHYIRFLKFERH